MAALLILCLLPFASQMPEGYEAAAERSGMLSLLAEDQAEIASIGQTNAAVANVQNEIVPGIQRSLPSDRRPNARV